MSHFSRIITKTIVIITLSNYDILSNFMIKKHDKI